MDEWGHVKISRKAFAENDWWNEPRVFSKWEAWEDCIQMASWKPRAFAIGFEVEQLQRGEFQASVRFLAARWRWAKWRVEKFLEVCQNRGQLQRQRNGQGGAIYLLVNYGKYQDTAVEERTPNRTENRTPNGHRTDKSEAVKANKPSTTWLTPFAQPWAARAGSPPFGKLAAVLKPLIATHGEPSVLLHWTRYLNHVDPEFWSVHRFAETFKVYDTDKSVAGLTDETIQYVDE